MSAAKKTAFAGKRKPKLSRQSFRFPVIWWRASKHGQPTAPPPGLPSHLAAELEKLGTGFENLTFFDYAFWLTPEQLNDPALRAIEEADRLDNGEPVAVFLRGRPRLTAWGKQLIADYKVRTRKGKRGRKAVPIYARSSPETIMMMADEEVRYQIRHFKLSERVAVGKAAASFGIAARTLAAYHDGRLGSTRRMRKRRRSRA